MATSQFPSLLALFNEIHFLSTELKRLSACHQEQQKVLLGARSLLQTIAEDGPQTVPSIAEVRNTSRQNIQIIANRLAELGCIEFIQNPRHKRSELLLLTEKGQAVLAASSEHETGILSRLSNRLPEAETQAALTFLSRLRSLMAEDADSRPKPSRVPKTAEDAEQRRKPGSVEASQVQNRSLSRESRSRTPADPAPQPPPDDESLPVNLL